MSSAFLSVFNVKVGAVTAEPITNSDGDILMGTGVVLTKKDLLLLKGWGIKAISVVSEEDNSFHHLITDSKEIARLEIKATELLKKRIGWSPNTNFEKDLWNIGFISMMEQLEKKQKQN